MTVGTWEVTGVNRSFVTARRRQATGAPVRGMMAVIRSERPVPVAGTSAAKPAIARPAAVAKPADQALLEAAEKKDIAGVLSAITAGANVDAGTPRHGITALI
jgi:hypothetical protein